MNIETEASSEDLRALRKAKRHEQTRIEILDAVLDLVTQDGTKDIRLLLVAKKLGLTKQALYHYYNSKEALIFDVILRELIETAEVIEKAVEKATNGAEGIEILMRKFFDRYIERMNIFTLVYNTYPSIEIDKIFGPKQLEQIHPLNKKLYGRIEKLLKIDQKNGVFSKKRKARLFAFNAHMSVIGILNMKAMTATVGDPLIHSNKSLIDDICHTFKVAATQGN